MVRYQQDLQVTLRDRLRQLLTAHHQDFAHQVDLTTAWIKRQPALIAILAAAERVEPELNYEQWIKNFERRELSWPVRTEEGKAVLIWSFMKHMANEDEADASLLAMVRFTFGSRFDEQTRSLTERVLAPLFDFLSERIGKDSNILYVLERYVRRVEWFEGERLFADFEKQTRRGEEIYDRDLRKFLFSEGVNMPFSQARSASGLSDALVDLDTEDPLVCEVKLFDAGDHGKRSIAAGLNQVLQYAHDFIKTSSYLVIINLSGRSLELPSDGEPGIWPRYVELGGVRNYLIPVRALPPTVSASKLGKASPVTVSRDDLVNPDVD